MLLVLPVSVESYLGSFGTDLPSEPMVIVLAGCTVLYLLFYKEELNAMSFRHPVFIILVLMFLWSVFVTFFSTDVILSVKYLLAKSWYLLGFFVLPVILLRNKKSIQLFFWCLFIPTLISVLFVIIRHGMLHFTFDNITKAVHPMYRNHVNYAVFITMILPFIFLAKSWYPKNYFRHQLLKYSIPVFLAAIYLSYTRGAWLATGALLVYLLILRFNLTKYVLTAASIGTILFSAYIFKDNNYLKYSPDFEHTIYHEDLSEHLSSTFEMKDMSTVERFYRWIAAVNLFKENPAVGVGPNNFVTNYKKYAVTSYETYISDNEEKSTVHNYFLLLLTEQGFPALVLFVILIFAILLTAQNTFNKVSAGQKKYVAAITLCIVVFLINNTLSDLVEANKIGSLFLMCLGLLVNFSTQSVELEND
jgi:O-antigen ligase